MRGRSSSVAAAVVACGFLQGAMAFTGNHAAALGRGLSLARPGAAAAAQRGYPRRRPALDLYMQNAPGKPPAPRAETGVLDLFVKSQPSSREGIDLFVGEDAAVFDWADEKMGALGERGWLTFFAAVGAILSALAVLWIYPATGYSDDFVAFLEDITGGNSHLVTLAFGIIFPIVHSGLASLRPYAEKIINFASFFFLYPSVFNLKEVAAVDVPQVHLWETGIMRITRHPQFVGQSMWSTAHLIMVGSSFNALTMALLVGHHAFACWNGDRRLYHKHGEAFLKVKERTSIVPFAAIRDGRQKLPADYHKELLRAPYALIAVGTLAAYLAHPFMQAGAALVTNTGLVEGGLLDSLF